MGVAVGLLNRMPALIAVVVFEVVLLAVDDLPAFIIECRAIGIHGSLCFMYPDAGRQPSGFLEGILQVRDDPLSGNSIAVFVKVVPFIVDHVPTGLQGTVLCATVGVGFCIQEQARILGLTHIDTILTKVIIVAVNLLDTGMLHTVDVVSKAAVLVDPTVLQQLHQGIAVGEAGIDAAHISAGFTGIIRVHEGIQAKGLLIFRFLRKGIQAACTQINVVADFTAVDCIQYALIIPSCILLGRHLNAAKDAHGVGFIGINRLRLLLPLQNQRQGIGLLVHLDFLQIEVFIDQLDLAVIHLKVGVNVHNGSNLRQNTDTLRQLQQEGPGRSTFQISTGQHIDQIIQLRRNGDLSHVNCKDIGGNHIFVDINNAVGNIVFRSGVGNLAVPSELTVAGSCLVEVKGCFTLVVQCQSKAGLDRLVSGQCDSQLGALYIAAFVSSKGEAVNNTGRIVLQGKDQVAGDNGYRLAIIQRLDRQLHSFTINNVHLTLGKINVVGHHNTQSLASNNLFAAHQVDVHTAVLLCSKHTLCRDRADRLIGNCPSSALRNLCGVTGGANAFCGHLLATANSHVIGIRLQNGVVKCSRAGCQRHHDQRGADRAGRTVGRSAYNLQFRAALRLCNVGGRATAVQVNCGNAACLQHDLCNFLHTAAAGHGFLSAIQNHENNLAGLGNTHSRTACTVCIVVFGSVNSYLSILNQRRAKCSNTITELSLINGVILFRGANHRYAVLRNAEEAVAVDGMVLCSAHNQQATGFAGAHIVACTVDTGNHIIVFNVILALRIAILFLCSICLIQNTRHCPNRRIVISVVCIYFHIASGNVCRRNVVDHLLTVCRGCMLNILGNARRQSGILAGEDFEIGIVRHIHEVTGKTAQIVSHRIAASLLQVCQIVRGEFTGIFQRLDHLVAGIGIVDGRPDFLTQRSTAQSVLQQVFGTGLISQIRSKVVAQQAGQRALVILHLLQIIHNVVAIQVTLHIRQAEAAFNRLLGETALRLQQIVIGQVLDHLINGTGNAKLICQAQQVNRIAQPTANVHMVQAEVIMIANIHHTEDMAHIRNVTIGQCKILQVLQTADHQRLSAVFQIGVVLVFQLADILGKSSVLIASHNTPGTGVIAFNAGADVLDNQRSRILTGILQHVIVCNFFQLRQNRNEGLIITDGRLSQRRDLHLGGIGAAVTCLVSLPASTGIGRRLAFVLHDFVAEGRNDLLSDQNRTADRAVGAFRQAGILAQSHSVFILNLCMAQSLAFGITAALILTHRRFRAGRICHLVPKCRNFFLCNQNLVADGAMLTFRQTGSFTLGRNCCVHNFLVAQSRNDFLLNQNFVTDRAVLAFRQAGVLAVGSDCLVRHFLMAHGCLFCVGGVIAAGAGHVGVPALFGAGRCLRSMAFFVMTQLGDDHLRIVTAAGARLIGSPTVFGTGHRLGLVVYNVMAQSGLFHLGRVVAVSARLIGSPADGGTGRRLGRIACHSVGQSSLFLVGGVVAAGAGHVGIPTNRGAGRCLGLMAYLVMTQSSDLLIGGVIAARAGFVGIPTNVGAGSGLGLMVCNVMAQCGNFHIIGGMVAAITGARFIGIPAGFRTGRCLCGLVGKTMAQSRTLFIRSIVAARAGLISIPAGFRTGRCLSSMGYCVVAQCFNDFLLNQNLVTSRAVLAFCQAGILAVGSDRLIDHFLVAQCSFFHIGGIVTAAAGHIGIPALFGAGGSLCCMGYFVMTQSRAIGCAADGASLGRLTGCIIPGMCLFLDDFLCNGHVSADGALLALGQTGGSAGGLLARQRNIAVMGGSRDGQFFFRRRITIRIKQAAANRAAKVGKKAALHFVGSMGRRLFLDQIAVLMAGGELALTGLPCIQISDLSGALCIGVSLAAGALIVILPAVSLTGSGLALHQCRSAGVGNSADGQRSADLAIRLPLSTIVLGNNQVFNTQGIFTRRGIGRNGVSNNSNQIGGRILAVCTTVCYLACLTIDLTRSEFQFFVFNCTDCKSGRNNNRQTNTIDFYLLVGPNRHDDSLLFTSGFQRSLVQCCSVHNIGLVAGIIRCRVFDG